MGLRDFKNWGMKSKKNKVCDSNVQKQITPRLISENKNVKSESKHLQKALCFLKLGKVHLKNIHKLKINI